MIKNMKKNIPNIKGKGQNVNSKLPQDMQNQIKDAFQFYAGSNDNISRQHLRSILGNFGFTKMNGKQIQDQISNLHQNKQNFILSQVIQMITKKWFFGRGRQQQAFDLFTLFDKKQRGLVGLNDIKSVFNQYLDINISDNDIMEFLDEADTDKDGYLSQTQFFTKLGYQ